MRGFPFLNLVFALLLSGAVMLPLVYRATRAAPVPERAESPADEGRQSGTVSSHVTLHFVHAPGMVRLMNVGTIVHEWKTPGGERLLEETVALPFHNNRTEFTVQAAWPAGTPETAVEIKVEPNGRAARSVNVWSTGSAADEIVTLTWEDTPP